MRLIINSFTFLLLGLAATSFAQTDEERIKERMWGEKFPMPADSIKEKYKDQPAVILYKNEIFEYSRKLGPKVNYDNYLHVRVLLFDATAVEEYSELSFSKLGLSGYRRDGTFIGIKVIKPDGSEREVKLDEAVKMRIFRDAAENRETKSSYNKVAIENLEKGDIVDFYIANLSRVNVTNYNFGSYFAFDPEIVVFKSWYPLLDGRVSFLAEKNCYINISLPEGYEEPTEMEKDDKIYYELKYTSDDKLKVVQWDAPIVTQPVLKFQVVAATLKGYEVSKHLIGKIGIPKMKTEKEDFQKLITYLAGTKVAPTTLQTNAYKFLNKQRYSDSPETLLRDLYYFTRHFLYFDYIELNGNKFFNSQLYDRFDVIRATSILLRKLKIEHEVFVGVVKKFGKIDNTMLYDELTPGIKVETPDGPVLFYTPGVQTMFNQHGYGMQGTKVYSATVKPEFQPDPVVNTGYLPAGDPALNVQIDSLRVKFTGEEHEVLVNRKLFATGGTKEQFSGIVWLEHLYFMDEVRVMDAIGNLNTRQKTHQLYLVGLFTKSREEELKESKDYAKLWLNEVNGITDPEDLKVNILSQGRSTENPAIRFSMNFRTGEIMSQTGDLLLVDMVKLFGQFAEFSEKEKERSVDIYMPCPRTLKWHIEIEIPEGYRAANPEVFNGSLQNSTGGFECRVTDQDGKLIVEATKIYNHDYEPLENWPELLSVIEYSNNLSQQKLVLSKAEVGN
ncbi:MAG: hypothetical protein AB9834_02010 [Lentimicrobium sp.]